MKKIIFVAQSLRKGGAERVISLLSKYFDENGYDVKIVLFENKVEYEHGGEIIDISASASKNYLVKLLRLFQRVKRLKEIFQKEKADCIFSFMESCNFASILTGFNVVVSVRNNPKKKFNWYQRLLIKFLYKRKNVKKIVCVSKEVENILKEDFNVKNTTTIYNPIMIDENYIIQEDLFQYKPFLLGIGRLHYQKNFEMLINAFSNSKTKEKANLLIVGEGDEKEDLIKLIKKLNLEGKVFLVGKKNNIKDYYLQCEIFILSSRFEGFPNVLVEALSNCCACISTNCPTGPNEIIKNGENGILIKNEDEKDLTKAIDNLFFNENLKNKFKKNAKKSVEYLNIEKIANKWLKLC